MPEQTTTPPGTTIRQRLRSATLLRHLLVAVAGLVVVVVALESTSAFRSVQLSTMAYYGIAAAGLTVLTGLNGQLSLGHGAFMAIGAYTTALCYQSDEPLLPVAAVMLLSAAAGLVVGAAVGVAAARLHGPYIAGATLALAVAVPGIPIYFSETLGGDQGLIVRTPEVPDAVADVIFLFAANQTSTTKYVAYLGWIALVVVLVLLANLARSRVGRTWRAVRDDEVAAQLAGIDVGRARVLAFVVSAAAAGLAGSVMAMAVRVAAPTGFTLTLSLSLLTAVVLGGLGSLAGALIGAGLLAFLPQLLTGVGRDLGFSDVRAAELAPLAYGLVLVAVILLAPSGIAGSVRGWWQRRAERRRAEPTTAATVDTPADTPADTTAETPPAEPASTPATTPAPKGTDR